MRHIGILVPAAADDAEFQVLVGAFLQGLVSGVPNGLTPSTTWGATSPSGTAVTFTVNANANSLAVGTYGG